MGWVDIAYWNSKQVLLEKCRENLSRYFEKKRILNGSGTEKGCRHVFDGQFWMIVTSRLPLDTQLSISDPDGSNISTSR